MDSKSGGSVWRRFGCVWHRSPVFFIFFFTLFYSKVKNSYLNDSTNPLRTLSGCLPSFCDSYDPLSKNRVFCWYITTKSENQYNLHRLHRNQSEKILQNIPYKPTSNIQLIVVCCNPTIGFLCNRKPLVLIIQITKSMERKIPTNTVQTNSTEKTSLE